MKKLLAILFAMLLIAGFVACSDDDDNPTTNSSSSAASSVSSEASSSAAGASMTIAEVRTGGEQTYTETKTVSGVVTAVSGRSAKNIHIQTQGGGAGINLRTDVDVTGIASGDVVTVSFTTVAVYNGLLQVSCAATDVVKTGTAAVVWAPATDLSAGQGASVEVGNLTWASDLGDGANDATTAAYTIRNESGSPITAATYTVRGHIGEYNGTLQLMIYDQAVSLSGVI